MQWEIQLRDGWDQEPRDSIGPFPTQGHAFSESRRLNVDLHGVPNPKVWPRWVFVHRQEKAESVPPSDQHKTIGVEVPKVAPPNPSAYSWDDDEGDTNKEEGLAVKTETFSFHDEEE